MTARIDANTRATVRRRTAATAKAPAIEPLRLKKRAPVEDEDRIALFEIDGEPYTMPAVIDTPRALALEIQMLGIDTERRKALFLIQQLCGMDAYRALMAEGSFTLGDLLALGQILSDHAFGQLEEDGEGN